MRPDFSELTDYDFESLSRDLLEAELGLPFELFTPGRDGGIDLRHLISRTSGKIVVQCKKWAAEAFPRLLRSLVKQELPKISSLAPSRYILVTSVQMTPANKDTVVEALRPWLGSPDDIYARDDIAGLLSRHPAVERRHIKLWLTSTAVLDAVVHSGVLNRTRSKKEELRRRLRLWVPNPSFERAKKLLEEQHVCVIAGAPGIGKSMLADILLAAYVSDGFEPILISSDIEEADSLWDAAAKQVFLYDDFLGRVSRGELLLKKNEEARLTDFISRVRRSKTKRFILTTREYILEEARSRYERLHSEPFEIYTYVLSLGEYTRLVRAKILYNHLYVSELPPALKGSLLSKGRYLRVIGHRFYSPRVIEHAIALPSLRSSQPESFAAALLSSLDDPAVIWELIYENLSVDARAILLAMASLPNEVFLEDLERAFEGCIGGRPTDPVTFSRSLRVLDGTFVRIERVDVFGHGWGRVVTLRDPSVRDYLRARLARAPGESATLVKSAVFFEQLVGVWDAVRGATDVEASKIMDQVASGCQRLLLSANPVLRIVEMGGKRSRERSAACAEVRAGFLVQLLEQGSRRAECQAIAEGAFRSVLEGWRRRSGVKSEAIRLLAAARAVPGMESLVHEGQEVLHGWLVDDLSDREDFNRLYELSGVAPEMFPESPPLARWRGAFAEMFADEVAWLMRDLDDPDWIDEIASDLDVLAGATGLGLHGEIDVLRERADEIRSQADDDDSSDDDRWRDESESFRDEEREIYALFASLAFAGDSTGEE